jgi:DNA primase
MANFPPPFLDEVLSRTDIVEIIARHVELKKSGSNMMGLCPFHNEKSPSFSVSPDKQLYYCFGCGKGGGAFQFLMDHDGYAFPEAVEYLAEKAGMEVPQTRRADPDEQARHRQAQEMLSKASDAFGRSLRSESGSSARAYLKQRGLPEDIVRDYGLGYAPSGYGFMQKVFGEDKRTLAQLEAVGLLFKGDHGYGDRFRGRLMFTIRDRRGHVVGFGGRVLGDGEPKYLNSPETAWFHKSDLLYGFSEHRDFIRKEKQLLIVEGYMDVLALAAFDLKIGLAPLGTAIGERQIREIFRLHEAPVFCFDGDRAGRQAAWRALERMLPLLKAELTPQFLYLPDGEDPDSLLKLEGADAFKMRLQEQPKPVLDTWLMGLKLLAGQGADGRARMAKKADAMLANMTDHYLQQAWRQEVEQATGISLQQGQRRTSVKPTSMATQITDKLTAVQERFLSALMQKNQRFLQLPEIATSFFVDNTRIKSLYSRAFSMKTDAEDNNTDIASQLIREFPDDQTMIARWVNQATVQDIEFESLVLDMEANHITRLLRQKAGDADLSERINLQNRIKEIGHQRRKLNEPLNETGA